MLLYSQLMHTAMTHFSQLLYIPTFGVHVHKTTEVDHMAISLFSFWPFHTSTESLKVRLSQIISCNWIDLNQISDLTCLPVSVKRESDGWGGDGHTLSANEQAPKAQNDDGFNSRCAQMRFPSVWEAYFLYLFSHFVKKKNVGQWKRGTSPPGSEPVYNRK